MRSPLRVPSVALFALVLCAAGCGPAASPETPANMDGAPGSSAPVPEPAGMLATVRLGAPATDLASLGPFIKPESDFARSIIYEPRKVVDRFLGALGPFVDLDAPVDSVFFDRKEPQPIVISLALRDFARARQEASSDFEFTREDDGRFTLTARPEGSSLLKKLDVACAVFSGGGPTTDHLVCAADRESLDAAGPYLARTVAREPIQPGLHAVFPESQMRQTVAKVEAKGEEPSSSASEEQGRQLGVVIGKQWAEDIRDMSIDLRIGTRGVEAGMDFRFRSLNSPLSLAMVGSTGKGVPQSFWSVPADADLAFYFPGPSPEAMAAATAPLWSHVADVQIPARDFDAVKWRGFIEKLSKLVLTGGPCIVAHGPAPDLRPAFEARRDPAARYQDGRAAALGWYLFSSFEPVETWTKNMRALLKQPTILPTDDQEISATGAPLGQSSSRRSMEDFKEIPVGAAEGLPAGSLHIVYRIVPNPGYLPRRARPALEGPYESHLFVAGTAESTWIAYSGSAELARERLKDIVRNPRGGIGERQDLARLRALPPGGIGFATLKGITATIADKRDTTDLARFVGLMADLGDLGGRGTTPMLFSLTPSGAGGGATLRIRTEVQKAGALDLITWVQQLQGTGLF